MNPNQLAQQCTDAFGAGKTVTLTHTKGQRLPRGWPRGVILSESRVGVNMAYQPGHILNWLRVNALIPTLEAV